MIRATFDGLTSGGLPVLSYNDAVWHYRRALVVRAINQNDGNLSAAARELRLARQTLYYLVRELRIEGSPDGVLLKRRTA